jgi:hypothetical protein
MNQLCWTWLWRQWSGRLKIMRGDGVLTLDQSIAFPILILSSSFVILALALRKHNDPYLDLIMV